jgi:hypothetical protein
LSRCGHSCHFHDLSLADQRGGIRFQPALCHLGNNIAAGAHHQFVKLLTGSVEVKSRGGKARCAVRMAIVRGVGQIAVQF